MQNNHKKPNIPEVTRPFGALIGACHSKLMAHMTLYVQWTLDVWSVTDGPMSIQDLLVMTAGLSGESGELLEQHAFMGTCKEDPRELELEFGDVLYYWARIIRHFEIDLASVLSVPQDFSFLPAGAARLPISTGVVSEAIKKFVRNDHRNMTALRLRALTDGLGLVWQDWCAMADSHAQDLLDVIAANQAKLHQRQARQISKRDRVLCPSSDPQSILDASEAMQIAQIFKTENDAAFPAGQ